MNRNIGRLPFGRTTEFKVLKYYSFLPYSNASLPLSHFWGGNYKKENHQKEKVHVHNLAGKETIVSGKIYTAYESQALPKRRS